MTAGSSSCPVCDEPLRNRNSRCGHCGHRQHRPTRPRKAQSRSYFGWIGDVFRWLWDTLIWLIIEFLPSLLFRILFAWKD